MTVIRKKITIHFIDYLLFTTCVPYFSSLNDRFGLKKENRKKGRNNNDGSSFRVREGRAICSFEDVYAVHGSKFRVDILCRVYYAMA